jgi:HD-GYP domain-containing protein (c-di-GMP phosphodiesterase class II)
MERNTDDMKTAVKKLRVESADLMIGMYVCDLDRPWLDSPFLIQGFYIKDNNDIDTVRNICEYVFVNKVVEREKLNSGLPGASSAVLMTTQVVKPGNSNPSLRLSRSAKDKQRNNPAQSEQGIEDFFPDKELTKYTDTVSWRDEARNARRAISYLNDYIIQFMQVSVKGDRVDLLNTQKAVKPMVDSVIRNPDACLWWTTMKPAGIDSNDSALRAAVYATVLGRQLGLPADDMYSLAIGGLLFDIGKLRLDDSILNADRKLTPEEMAMMQRHVEIGLSLLKRSGLSDPIIIDFIANHHERLDCSGYPQGLGGDLIPVFGRIAGLVDCYNAITSSRRYASTRSPAEAINQLYKLKGVHFHKDLIEEFIQAIGVYPVGALVELSTGEVAIVVAQSRSRRLRPVVLVLLDGNKKPARAVYILLDETMHSDDGQKLDIVKNLEPNAHGIDRASIKLS